MARIIVGRFTRTDLAAKAAEEVRERHLSLAEPRVVNAYVPDFSFMDQSRSFQSQQRNLDKTIIVMASLFWILGVVAMIVLGQLGKAVVHLPVFFALWAIAAVRGVRELQYSFRKNMESRSREATEVIVTTQEPAAVEDIFAAAGADEVTRKAA